jgi:hypothetical protein
MWAGFMVKFRVSQNLRMGLYPVRVRVRVGAREGGVRRNRTASNFVAPPSGDPNFFLILHGNKRNKAIVEDMQVYRLMQSKQNVFNQMRLWRHVLQNLAAYSGGIASKSGPFLKQPHAPSCHFLAWNVIALTYSLSYGTLHTLSN